MSIKPCHWFQFGLWCLNHICVQIDVRTKQGSSRNHKGSFFKRKRNLKFNHQRKIYISMNIFISSMCIFAEKYKKPWRPFMLILNNHRSHCEEATKESCDVLSANNSNVLTALTLVLLGSPATTITGTMALLTCSRTEMIGISNGCFTTTYNQPSKIHSSWTWSRARGTEPECVYLQALHWSPNWSK